MALILSLETATPICSAALHRNGRLVVAREIMRPQAHAEELASLVGSLFAEAGFTMSQLEAVAVSSGPGSYTGLRIGTSTAKGICHALSLPLIALPTLELMVHSARMTADHPDLYCPMLDARRMEVYYLLADSAGQPLEQVRTAIVDEGSFAAELEVGTVLFFGSGAAKCKPVIRHKNARFLDGVSPTAAAMGSLAMRNYESGRFEPLQEFEPLYVKEFYFRKPATVS